MTGTGMEVVEVITDTEDWEGFILHIPVISHLFVTGWKNNISALSVSVMFPFIQGRITDD